MTDRDPPHIDVLILALHAACTCSNAADEAITIMKVLADNDCRIVKFTPDQTANGD